MAEEASEGLQGILGSLTVAPDRLKAIAASTPSALQDLATATWGSTNHITGMVAILSPWGWGSIRMYIYTKHGYALCTLSIFTVHIWYIQMYIYKYI
jgi:hypothetical protein